MAVKDLSWTDLLDLTESYVTTLRRYEDFAGAMQGVTGLMAMTEEVTRRALNGEMPEPEPEKGGQS
jgi:hypothetical protein